ncbi:hypothetical protein [Butyrivibrio sp. INlla21]|uniref:hypothetical protein n=1 Tax=Butyrivibrio sp. INlla21 TaxID=1520811 RepID=UPI0008EBE313|nr:hypothetical protein [Butyrivibrio sp. INlla21]SFU36130.1 hypothetical protein SAMN02910342_00240 [Butyrivibrio sp. INlla21]
MSEKHSKGTSLNLDEIKDLLSDIRNTISETQRAAEKPLNIKANSAEVHTANQEIEALFKNLNNIKKSNTLQKYFTDAETAQKNLAKAYENYQSKIKNGSEKQAKQAMADVARYANAFSALGGKPDVVDKKIKSITSKYMKANNPSTGWLYDVDNFKEAFAIMQQIENLAPGTFFKNISNEAEKAGDAVTQSVKKIKDTVEGDSIAKNIFNSDEGEREANKLVETLDRIWAKVSVGNKELSSSEAIDFATAFHQLNYYLEQTPRKMDDARAALVDFKKFLSDIYDFLPENQRSELTDFMSTPNGKVDQKAMLGIAIEYWQELAKEINQASDAQKNFYSNQFVEIPNLTEAQKEYRKLVEWVREYYELTQKSKKGNRSIVPYGDDALPGLVYGGDARRKNGQLHTTQASLKRLLSDYDDANTKGTFNEQYINNLIDRIAAYTYALDKSVDAEKLFGKAHAELFTEVALRIKNAEEAADAFAHSQSLTGLISSSAKSMGGNLVTYGDFDKFEKVLLSDGVEGGLKYLVETLGMKLPEAVKEATDATDGLTSSEKKAGEAAEETSTKDNKATESKKKKTEATKASAKAAEEEAKAEEEAARKAEDAQKQREWNAKKIAQQLQEASERVYKSETHNANGSVTSTDYIDHFRTRTTKSGYDKNGDYYVLESTKENYVELEKQIQRNDKAITRLTKDMYLNAKAGADTSAWQNQIDALEEYSKVLLEIRNAGWVGSDENLPEEFHAEVFDTERLKAQKKDWESVIASAQKTLKRFIADAESVQSKPLMPELSTNVDNLVDNLKQLSAAPQIDFKDSNIDNVRQQVVAFLTTLRDLESELNVVSNQSRQSEFIPADIKDITSLNNNIMAFMDNNTAMGKESKEALNAVHIELQKIIDTGEQISKVRLDELAAEANNVEAKVRSLHQTGNSFFRSFTKQLKSANAQFLATYFSLQDMMRYAREIVTTVTQIDSALTELRKVSDASTERLVQNFEVSAKTAKELGSSITHVINITADWARLNKLGLFV